jgi:5-methylcytosine-specific restriction endonuclease McrA
VKKKPITPNSQIRSALRQLWLRSRERAAAIKRDHNTCTTCGKKGSVAKGREVKIEVHHIGETINWERILEYVRRHLLVDPKFLECLCKECHAEETKRQAL